jgi:hypothetical protein
MWSMINILVMLLSIAFICLASGWVFGAFVALGTATAVVSLVSILVGLRLARASHVSTSLFLIAIVVVLTSVIYKMHAKDSANSQKVDISGRVTVQWRGPLDVGQSGTFTLTGVSGFQWATASFHVEDADRRQATCAADTTLGISTGSANNSQSAGTIGPFSDADQSKDLPVPPGTGELQGTVIVRNSVNQLHCPVTLSIDGVIVHH